MDVSEIKLIAEAALLAAGRPLSVKELGNLFDPKGRPDNELIRSALKELGEDCESRAYELKEVGSGFRFQVRNKYGLWVSRLWEEKPPRYSRALLETLALIAYKQPLTRGEIEDVRGVAVSTHIIRTLLERGWVRVVGHRDAPGKPAMYATTREFLDYFNLKNLNQLPSLAEIKDIAAVNPELELEAPPVEGRSIELPVEESAEGGEEQPAGPEVEMSKAEVDALMDDVQAHLSDEASDAETDGLVEADAAGHDEDSGQQAEAAAEPEAAAAAHDDSAAVPDPEDVDPNSDFDSLPN